MLSISLGDILKALDQFKAWPRITAGPDRIDALEARVAALEAAARAPAPRGEPCPWCGGGLTLTSETPDPTFGAFGVMQRVYGCAACGKSTRRQFDPRKDR